MGSLNNPQLLGSDYITPKFNPSNFTKPFINPLRYFCIAVLATWHAELDKNVDMDLLTCGAYL